MNTISAISQMPSLGSSVGPVVNLEGLRPHFNNGTNNGLLAPSGGLEFGAILPQGFKPVVQSTIGVDTGLLANIGGGLDFSQTIRNTIYSVQINTEPSIPFQLNQSELRSLSFDTILDRPHSINSLFSEEIKDLVKNLVEMQKQKLAVTASANEKTNDTGSFGNISDSKGSLKLNQVDNHLQSSPQINHLLGSTQTEVLQKEKPQEKSSSHRSKQIWEEQSDTPYLSKKKKEGKGLAKIVLSSIGKNLEKISRALLDASS